MSPDVTLDTREVARRFEQKHLKLSLGLAVESLRFRDSAFCAYGGPGGYSNRLCGFDIASDDLDPAIRFFADRGEDTKIEITSFASAELLSALNERHFRLRFFTHVLAMPARDIEVPIPEGITIGRLDRTNPDAIRATALHNERCFAGPDQQISELTIALTSRHLQMPTNDTFLAHANGELVGVGCSETSDGLTMVFGGATRPDWRGRGLQNALIAARLAWAKERGSDLVTVMAGPGTSSERNALRAGFAIAYARTYLVGG